MTFELLEYTNKHYSPFSFNLSTPHEEPDDPYNVLSIGFFRWGWYFKVPQLLKPVGKKVKAGWDAATVARLGRDWYMDYTPKNYGFTVLDDAIHLAYGIQPGGWSSGDKENSDHVKVLDFPWNLKHVRHTIYTKDGVAIPADEWQKKDHLKYSVKDRDVSFDSDFYGSVYTFFRHTDKFDGMSIPAKAHISEREWNRGSNKFWRLLKYFPGGKKVVRSLEVDFKYEVGERKTTWKGGTVGCGIEMLPGEDIREAIARFNAIWPIKYRR